MMNFEEIKEKLGKNVSKEASSTAVATFNLLRTIHVISTAFNAVMSTDLGKTVIGSVNKSISYVTPEFGELKKAHFNFEVDLMRDSYKRLIKDDGLAPEIAMAIVLGAVANRKK